MQVADNGSFELWQFRPHCRLAPEKGERRGVMAEEQHPLPGLNRLKRLSDLAQMFFSQSFPFRAL